MKLVKPAGNYSVQIDDEYIYYDSGSPTVILPRATGSYRQVVIINLGAGIVVVNPQNLETIQANTSVDVNAGYSVTFLDLELQKWIVL